MGESPRTFTRGRLITLISITLLAGGLFGLLLPVSLGSFDAAGIQVKCGNGYHAELVQATVDDEQPASAGQAAPAYAHHCMDAIAHRRELLIPLVALGALILMAKLLGWSRVASGSSAADNREWSEEPSEALHEAHVLDRRYHSRWQPPSDTTL